MIELSFESTRTITQAEFARWCRQRARYDINHYELLNGRVVMNPPAGHPHGSTELRVGRVIGNHVADHALGEAFGSSQGFDLPTGDTIEPDCSFVSQERWEAMPEPVEGAFLKVVPDLVVEILSPSTASRDRGEKKAIYERNGVREYWLVDPRARELTVFTLVGDRFDGGRVFAQDDDVSSEVLTGLSFEVRAILP